MYRLVNDRVEALEFIIRQECAYTNVPLKNLKTKQNNLIACIGRKGKIIIPNGDDHMEVGDSVVIITMEHRINDLQDIIL